MSEDTSKDVDRLAPESSHGKPPANRSVSSFGSGDGSSSTIVAELPWGGVKLMGPSLVDVGVKPGEYVAQTLLVEFMTTAEKKINLILQDSLEKPLTKWLQRGEDSQFDQLLNALCNVSEHCLPSVLKALFVWYDHHNRQLLYLISQPKVQQTAANAAKTEATKQNSKTEVRQERDYLLEKKGLAVDFIFCLVLIEILKQLPLHPGHDDLVGHIVQLCFKQFRYKDPNFYGVNTANVHIIADLFAEVVGVMAQSRFHAVRKKFLSELAELKSKENLAVSSQNIVSLLMGMKFFRVKMVPIEEFEISMNFLHELGLYFLDVKDREIKHALAGLFVEILLPVAAHVKTEVNVPSVKNFVDLLYSHTLDWAAKRKHSLAFFPLLTCLLCISQKHFYLSNWHYFLTMCLSNLKHKDPKMSRVALESLYRLVWVYVVRIKCESNTATQSRLQSICNSLFPKGGRYVVPRDTPLNIFVKILHFIAQERLDFAFKEVIFDLLCVGRPIRTIYPERMNIGLRALLVIADSLQQRDGPPPMPRTIGVLPSGNTLRVKRTYLTKPLTTDIARTIGIDAYYAPCIRAFEGIVRALDLQVGRPMMMTVVQSSGRETEDLLGGERKPKLDLFRTCIAAIPRVLPDNMSHQDVIELLIRLTVHMDDELRALACQTLQNLVVECGEWRDDIIYGLLQFITKEIHDSYLHLLDSSLRLLHQLLLCWKGAVYQQQATFGSRRCSSLSVPDAVQTKNLPQHVRVAPVLRAEGSAMVLHCVEGLVLVMLCQSRNATRRLAVNIMKEIRQMLPILCSNEEYERPVIDVLDSAVGYVVEKYVQHVQQSEKASWPSSQQADFLWAVDKIPSIDTDYSKVNLDHGNEYLQWDPWAAALSGFLEPQFLLTQCPTAISYAWPVAHMRISAVFTYVDPNNPQNDTRASLLRSSKSKSTAAACGETLNHSNYLSLWEKYLVFACGVAPPAFNGATVLVRSVSPLTLQNANDLAENLRPSELRIPRVANVSATNLFRQVLPLLRCEMADMRDLVVLGLGSINPASFECLMDELSPLLREAAERKQENVRRKKRKDLLRLQLIRLLEMAVFRQTLSSPLCRAMVDHENGHVKQVLLDVVENARLYLESDHDRDPQLAHALHLHFAKFISSLVKSFSVDKRANLLPNETRKNLFYLFASWSGRLGLVLDRRHLRDRDNLTSEEYFAVAGMCAVLTCGPVFDSNAISDENGYIYGWMDALIGSQNEKIVPLSEETLILLLDYNSESAHLLDWVIDKCFSSPARIADKCFRALVTVFSTREYPCDVVSMMNLTLMYAGYPVTEVQQYAVDLLQILHQRFFAETVRYQNIDEANRSDDDKEAKKGTNVEQNVPNPILPNGDLVENGFSKSQLFLSQQLAALHPEMTMQIFSEISLRSPGAKPARRAAMLRYLLPWLYNVELVDPYLESSEKTFTLSLSSKIAESHNIARRILKGEGWGSQQGTEMILNNLLYLTVKFGNEHANLLESLWMGLTTYWPHNLRVILRYIMVMTTLAPESLLAYTKRIVIYIARVNPERLVEELMNELQTIDVFRCPVERCDVAPFFRWVRRTDDSLECMERARGTIHTRRHTPSEAEPQQPDAVSLFDADVDPGLDTSASMASLVTLTPEVVMNQRSSMGTTPATIMEIDERSPQKRRDFIVPFQLPMPAYGGHYCPLSEFIQSSSQTVNLMHRSNLAVLLITDLVISDADIEWTVHLPLMLHVAVLGLDHSKALIHDHCKQLLINLIVMHSSGFVRGKDVALVLISRSLGSQISLHSRATYESGGSLGGDKFGSVSSKTSELLSTTSESTATSAYVQTPAARTRSVCTLLERDGLVNRFDGGVAESAIGITDFLASKKGSPLWSFEDITGRNWRILSAEHLTNFVSHLTRLFSELLPASKIESRWAQTALHIALCCSNRHYAGRSFQILRALRFPLTSRMLFDVLSRLVETAAEPGDDMQGYVTEIMLTLDSSILHMEVAEHSLANLFRESQTTVANAVVSHNTSSATPSASSAASTSTAPANQQSPTHHRSISHSVAMTKRSDNKKDWRSSVSSIDENGVMSNIPRSKSAHALKSAFEGQDEHVVALSHLLWIAVSMLESDYEHEYLLALRVLEKLIDLSVVERQDCFDRLDRMVKQLNWVNFPGVLSLVLKGCAFANTYECAVQVINKILPMLDWPTIEQNGQQNGFALCVTALMPYMLLHFEDPTKLCICAAENIAEYCAIELERATSGSVQQQQASNTSINEHPLQPLAAVMRSYSKRTFSKDWFHFTKCVTRYVNDTYPQFSTQILVFLTEVLDRGPPILNLAILQLMYCMFHHVDLMPSSAIVINGEFLKVVARHLQGANWMQASRILKLAVTRSSSFTAPSGSSDGAIADGDSQRKELPGRTMDFNLDVMNVVLGLTKADQGSSGSSTSTTEGSPRKQNLSSESLLRRSTIANTLKVREHLLSLLNASGLRVGLPKSPSESSVNKVIFSQSSHDIGGEPASSVYSSSGELTNIGGGVDRACTPSPENQTDVSSDTYAPVFREFDFLEGEQDSISESAESCFNWLSTMRPRSISNADDERVRISCSGIGAISVPHDIGGDHTQHSVSDSSDDEESTSSQADEDSAEGILVPDVENLFVIENPADSDRAATPASISLCGSIGTPSVADAGVQHWPPFSLECSHHATGLIDEIWSSTVGQVNVDADGSSTASLLLIFAQLYREACSKLCSLVRDSCHFLSMTQTFRDISLQFTESLDVLMRVADCPFIFATSLMLQSTGVLQRQKCYLLELREHYETFQERREYTIKCLNTVKSSLKLQLMGQKVEEHSTADQEIELCRSLHKLFFQLLLMCENYTKMVQYLSGKTGEQAASLTADVQVLHRELLRAVNELSASNECLPPSEMPGSAQQRLIQLIQARDTKQAVLQLRSLRGHNNRVETFGCCEEVDVEVLLLLFCKISSESRSCFAIIGSETSLADNCNQLMEANIGLSTSVRALNDAVKGRIHSDCVDV